MTYTILAPEYPDPRITVQFFFSLLPDEDPVKKENMVRFRICNILKENCNSSQLTGSINEFLVAIHPVNDGSNRWLAVVPFCSVTNIDESGSNQDSVFTQILHGKGYADFQLPVSHNQPDEYWAMWGYNLHIWHLPPNDDYIPFITPDDYKEFEKNADHLPRCIKAFQREVPTFIRKQWPDVFSEEFDENLDAIMYSNSPIESFNKMIDYPSHRGAAAIDSLFVPGQLNSDTYSLLSRDSYAIFGYFYHVIPMVTL